LAEIRVEQGVVRGDRRGGVFRFRGLPYAAAPVGERRWAAPAPPPSWDGVREATEFGHAAIQMADPRAELGAVPSEDCLNLNIWSPTLWASARLPVMVWIHGGGFLQGAASMKQWHGRTLARRGVVLVSINYRLGVLGFLRHPEVGGNFAVQDWVAALRWVAGNITAFGGDPDNVTVFGQSAGAEAVRTLLSTPAARGLFHRGILQSGGFDQPAAITDTPGERLTAASTAFFELVGGRDLDHLRALPVDAVRRASRAASPITPPDQVHTAADLVWRPTVDGRFVGEDLSSWDPDVPVLFGSTEHEARFFITPGGPFGGEPAKVCTAAAVENMAKVLGGARADDILAELTGSPYERLAELCTAALWTEPLHASYQRFAETCHTAYAYRFARVSPSNRASGMLAHHCAELPHLFGHHDPEQLDDVDAQLSAAMQHAWTTFALDGVPRGLHDELWPWIAATEPRLTVIGDTVHVAPLSPSPVTTLIHSLRAGR